jgi:hypothetical protein
MPLAPIPFPLQRRWPHHLTLLLAGALLLPAGPLPAAAVMAQTPEVATPRPQRGGENFASSNPSQRGLAEHLRRQGYVFYGAWWCPACNQQKSLFGQPAAQRPAALQPGRHPRLPHLDEGRRAARRGAHPGGTETMEWLPARRSHPSGGESLRAGARGDDPSVGDPHSAATIASGT